MSEIEDSRSARPYVVPFDSSSAIDRPLVGGKGANLVRLVAEGIPVPKGFCVTTVAFHDLLTDEVRDLIRALSDLEPTDSAAIADAGATIRKRIRNLDVPAEIRESIGQALDEDADSSNGTYAVRSSATAEDLPEASFAGQQETFLNIRGTDAIIDRVRACMASLFTDRAIAYRARNDISHEDAALAVVVQRMVSPDISGILFTADPTTGNRYVAAIEAGLGLGDAFVSGEAATDSVRVDTRTKKILNYEVGDQQVAVRPRSEGGVETVELESAERTTHVLSDEQAKSLVELGVKIEAVFEHPQDIEWCIEDGAVYVVQARPITSLFPVPSPEPSDGRLHVYVSIGHSQAFAEAMPPLVRDIWMEYTQTTFEKFGFGADTQWAAEAGGRVYMDVTKLLRIGILRNRLPDSLATTSEPTGAALENILEQRRDEFHEDRSLRETATALPELARGAWTGTVKGFPLVATMLDGFFTSFIGEPNPPGHEEVKWVNWGRNVANKVHTRNTPKERALTVFDQFDDALDYPAAGPLLAGLIAGSILEGLFPNAQKDVNDVGRGFPDEIVTRINLGLGDLTDIARANPAVADALQQEASLEEIESVEDGDQFRSALEEYLGEFGHRATGEMDISRPRWREEPSGLLAAVRANLSHGEAGEHRQRIQEIEQEAFEAAKRLEECADKGFLGPVRKLVVRQLIRTYRGCIQTREYPKQGAAHMFTAWHEALLDTGELLVTEGRLNRAEDIWFLRKNELITALDGRRIDADIAARRSEFERYKSLDAPPVVTSEGEAPSGRIEREDVPEGALVGTGVSGGLVEGIARVVRDPSEETVKKGEILIAPTSDPGWTPLFLNAAGMVVEVGGQMSHGALVAREYGLPAVVSVPEATRRIQTGQRIRVDGTNGIVEVIERKSVPDR